MQDERIWTVYMHTVPNGKRYIGITSKKPEDRWGKDGSGYEKQMFMNAINKYGWDNIEHKILFTNLTHVEANCKEKFLIKYYNTTDRNYGYNRSYGGDKTTKGLKYSDESKNKIRQKARDRMKAVYQYDLDGNFVAEYESIKSASRNTGAKDAHISEICHNETGTAKGYTWRFYKTDKIMSPTARICRKVYQYNLQGEFIAEYNSISAAANDNNMSDTAIAYCCKGIIPYAKGYLWSYEKVDMHPYEIKKERGIKITETTKKVYQYNMDGDFIQEYLSIGDASLKTGFHRGGIYNVCIGKRRYAYGYIWSYEFNDKIKMKSHKLCKEVYQYSLNKEFITKYNSIIEAAEAMNIHKSGIQACCTGRQKTAKDFIWSYEELN